MTADEFKTLCRTFPEVTEGFNMGSAYVKAGGKDLARVLSGERVMFTGVPIEEVEMLCEADPLTFWADAHYKNARCLVAHLSRLDGGEARRLLERRFREIARKAVLKAWDAARDPSHQ